jgi:hypothetical protein
LGKIYKKSVDNFEGYFNNAVKNIMPSGFAYLGNQGKEDDNVFAVDRQIRRQNMIVRNMQGIKRISL